MIRKLFTILAFKFYPSQVKNLAEKIYSLNRINYQEESQRLKFVIYLLISGEDHRFRFHPGFDLIAITRAIKQKIINNKSEGASTIDQQLVRVLIGDYRKCFGRKIKEIFLATTLTKFINRKNIPILYLHTAYFGTGITGIQQYIEKREIRFSSIDLRTAAEIVARIKYPEPQAYSIQRINKIDTRVRHLLKLYKLHSAKSFINYYKLS